MNLRQMGDVMKRFALGLVLVSLSCLAFAADTLQPRILLKRVEVIQAQENYGDEVYMVITEFAPKGANRQYTVPDYPVHWPSKHIDQIKDANIWQAKLADGEQIEVILEAVEHDAPPFNVDDSLGSVVVKVKNNKGKLEADWKGRTNLVKHETKQVDGTKVERFTFTSDDQGGKYALEFVLDNAPEEAQAKEKQS